MQCGYASLICGARFISIFFYFLQSDLHLNEYSTYIYLGTGIYCTNSSCVTNDFGGFPSALPSKRT